MKKFGMTLVEVMVGVIISSVVLGAGYGVWSYARRDISTASTRQTLQHEIRHAMDTMSNDFKAIKAGSLKIQASGGGTSASIKFEKYVTNKSADKLDSKSVMKIEYNFNQLTHTLTRKAGNEPAHTLSTAIDSLDLSRGGSAANVTSTDVNSANIDAERGMNARMDISITGTRKIQATGKIAEHTEKTSIVMREEYYAAVNKGHISTADLTGTDTDKISDATPDSDAALTMGALSEKELAGMTKEQLDDLHKKESDAKEEALKQMGDLDKAINSVDALESRSWGNLGGLLSRDTEVSKIQKELEKHTKVPDLESDVKKLQDVINRKEGDFMDRSVKNSADKEKLKDPKEQSVYKEAYDTLVKDRAMKKAYEANPPAKDDSGKTPEYKSLLSNINPESLKQGEGTDGKGNTVTFKETNEQFTARKDHATKVYDASKKMDVSWMDSAGDEVKEYNAAKDLSDLANSKLAYAQTRDTRQENLDKIDTVRKGK